VDTNETLKIKAESSSKPVVSTYFVLYPTAAEFEFCHTGCQ